MVSLPERFTLTECLRAIQNDADGLKIFPASLHGINGFKARNEVLPTNIPLYAVGGVDALNLSACREVGASSFGLGTCIYEPGDTLSDVKEKAQRIVHAYEAFN